MPPLMLVLDIQTPVSSWKRVPQLRARLQKAAQATQAYLPALTRVSATATILLTGNTKVRQLNFDFRGINRATNVLSFPQFLPQELRTKKQKAPIALGDIALAYQYVASEASTENKLLIDHVTHLVVHGLLHLFGYDHIRDTDARRMEKAEIEIMKSLGLSNPYAPPRERDKKRKA